MTNVVLIPSVLGLRKAFYDFADDLRVNGHEVTIVDIYGGGSRDDYEEGRAILDEVGVPTLLQRALDKVKDEPTGFVPIGFSIGAYAAQHIATQVSVSGAVMIAGAAAAADLAKPWPKGVPAQIHASEDDEFLTAEEREAARMGIIDAGGECEVFTYPGAAHLFMDGGLSDEYDPRSADQLLRRVLEFLDRLG